MDVEKGMGNMNMNNDATKQTLKTLWNIHANEYSKTNIYFDDALCNWVHPYAPYRCKWYYSTTRGNN